MRTFDRKELVNKEGTYILHNIYSPTDFYDPMRIEAIDITGKALMFVGSAFEHILKFAKNNVFSNVEIVRDFKNYGIGYQYREYKDGTKIYVTVPTDKARGLRLNYIFVESTANLTFINEILKPCLKDKNSKIFLL